MSIKDNRWKLFYGARRKEAPFTAADVLDAYRTNFDPDGMKLERGYRSVEQFLESIPGFKRIQDDVFMISEQDALSFFKQLARTTNKESRAVEAFVHAFKSIFKAQNVDVPVIERDLLTHFCLTPPPNVGYLKMSRLFAKPGQEDAQDMETAKKCFSQFEKILLLHSRATRLFDSLPEFFTAEKFNQSYCEKFEEINFDDSGFNNVQELLEWIPELHYSNYHFSLRSGNNLKSKKFPCGVMKTMESTPAAVKKVRFSGRRSVIKCGWEAIPRDKATTRSAAAAKKERLQNDDVELVFQMDAEEAEDEMEDVSIIKDEPAHDENTDIEAAEELQEARTQMTVSDPDPHENQLVTTPKTTKRGPGRPRKILQ